MANLYSCFGCVKCCCYCCSITLTIPPDFLNFDSLLSFRIVLHILLLLAYYCLCSWLEQNIRFFCQFIACFDCLMFCGRLRSHTFSRSMATNPCPIKYPTFVFGFAFPAHYLRLTFLNAWWPGKYQNNSCKKQKKKHNTLTQVEKNKKKMQNIKERSPLSWLQLRCINCVQLIRIRMWFGASTAHCIVCWHFVAL